MKFKATLTYHLIKVKMAIIIKMENMLGRMKGERNPYSLVS